LVDLSVGKPAKKVNKVLLFHAPHDINLVPKPGNSLGSDCYLCVRNQRILVCRHTLSPRCTTGK